MDISEGSELLVNAEYQAENVHRSLGTYMCVCRGGGGLTNWGWPSAFRIGQL